MFETMWKGVEMGRPDVIPQSVYDEAVSELLTRIDGGHDLEAFRAVYLLHQAADAAREFQCAECLDQFGLTWTQFQVLWNIWIFGEREAGWVARAAMVSKSGLTTILNELGRRGYLVRSADASDGRKSLVALTDEGQQKMRDVFNQMNKAESAFAEALTDEQRKRFSGLLDALLAAAPGLVGRPPASTPQGEASGDRTEARNRTEARKRPEARKRTEAQKRPDERPTAPRT